MERHRSRGELACAPVGSFNERFEAAAEIRATGDRERALAAYHAIFLELQDEDDLESREAAAYALVLEAHVLASLGRFEDKLAIRRLILEREREAPELELRERVARTLVNMGSTYARLGRPEARSRPTISSSSASVTPRSASWPIRS